MRGVSVATVAATLAAASLAGASLAGVPLAAQQSAGQAARDAAGLPGAVSRAATPQATLERAVAAYRAVRTLRANFIQVVTNPLTGGTDTARGVMVQRRPAQLAVRFTNPAGDRIVSDGQWLWIYLPSTAPGQVIRMPATRTGAGTPDVAAQFLDRATERYTVSDGGRAVINGRPTRAVVLVPRPGEQAPFSRATIWVDYADGMVRRFRTEEPSGLERTVTILELTKNPPVPDAEFRFSPPEGVRIFDRGAM